jgi:hypothetical protein
VWPKGTEEAGSCQQLPDRATGGGGTFRLLALTTVGDSHHTQSTASFTRTRRTVTHSAGLGSLEGLHQKNSCARWKPIFLHRIRGSSKW